MQESSAEVGFAEVGFSEVSFKEVDFAEVGSAEVGSAEVDFAEVGSAEVGFAEVGFEEGSSAEVGSAEVGSAEVGLYLWVLCSPVIPNTCTLLHDSEMFLVCHVAPPVNSCIISVSWITDKGYSLFIERDGVYGSSQNCWPWS